MNVVQNLSNKRLKDLIYDNVLEFSEYLKKYFLMKDDILEKERKSYLEEVNKYVCYMINLYSEDELTSDLSSLWLNKNNKFDINKVSKKNNRVTKVSIMDYPINLNGYFYVDVGIPSINSKILVRDNIIIEDQIMNKPLRLVLKGKTIIEAEEILDKLGFLDEESEFKNLIHIYKEQVRIHENFLKSIIYALILQGGEDFGIKRAILFIKNMNINFDFSQVFGNSQIKKLIFLDKANYKLSVNN